MTENNKEDKRTSRLFQKLWTMSNLIRWMFIALLLLGLPGGLAIRVGIVPAFGHIYWLLVAFEFVLFCALFILLLFEAWIVMDILAISPQEGEA